MGAALRDSLARLWHAEFFGRRHLFPAACDPRRGRACPAHRSADRARDRRRVYRVALWLARRRGPLRVFRFRRDVHPADVDWTLGAGRGGGTQSTSVAEPATETGA